MSDIASAPISFVISAYNDIEGVARHFEYFTRLGEPVELIVVDDCSTDGLEAFVAQADLPAQVRIRFHRNAVNLGAGPSRNTGLAMVSSDYTMFLDADDLLADTFFHYIRLSPLANGVDFVLFKYHLSAGMAGRQSYTMHTVDNLFFSNIPLCSYPDRSFTLAEIPSVLRTVNFPWNKVYRTDFLRRARISFPDHRMHEDILPHWASFLAARRFGILHWAPPLIHHFEAPRAGRATNYTGEQRLAAFETLLDVHARIRAHPLSDMLLPEVISFSENLVEWMIRAAPPEGRERYRVAADVYFDRIGRGRVKRPASVMGQLQT